MIQEGDGFKIIYKSPTLFHQPDNNYQSYIN